MKSAESLEGLDPPSDPMSLFRSWFAFAKEKETYDPTAMALATVDDEGRPTVRMVLLKGLDAESFVFYTNRESRKGGALAENPQAALCFYWPEIGRQVRVEGPVQHVSDRESDSYFATRPRASQISAHASQQSKPLESREELVGRIKVLESDYEGQDVIPRPLYWGGYRLAPDRMEFWEHGQDRLHKRLVYIKEGGLWQSSFLYP